MSGGSLSSDEKSNLRAAYEQVCSGYQAIDDFRAKLLSLLPLASGAGIFLLFSDVLTGGEQPALPRRFLLPIGAFGFVVTLGLYFYELRGIQYCNHLIAAGRKLEQQLEVSGRFSTRPKRKVAGFISEVPAAHLIYAAVLAAWTFVAAVFAVPGETPGDPAALLGETPGDAAAVPGEKPGDPAILLASLLALVVFGGVLAIAPGFDLRPAKEPDLITCVISKMLALVQSLPSAAAVRTEIEGLQQRLRKLCQKDVALSSEDWQRLRDTLTKIK